jgi:hypothetical protein
LTGRATIRRAWLSAVGALLLVALAGMAAVPAVAGAQNCLETSPSYMDACGPTFAVPTWTDAGGWTDPSQYSTIQLADVNGDGKDELLGRGDAGLQIWWFDTSVGQWRPQVDTDAVPQILSDFSSPPAGMNRANDWTKPYYYSTIQAANIDGQPGAEILARFWDGMRVYKYLPPSGGTAIDGGTWKRIGTAGPFSDAEDYGNVSLYPTIHVVQPTADSPPVLYARRHSSPGQPSLVFYSWQNGGWTQLSNPSRTITGFSDQECGQPSCYLNLQTARLRRPGFLEEVMGRNASGVSVFAGTPSAGWTSILGRFDTYFADVAKTEDCPFSGQGASGPGSGDCLGSSPSYYETLRVAPVFGRNNFNMIARASDGLRLRWTDGQNFYDGTTLGALGGAASAVQPGQWGSIRTGNIDGVGGHEVLALDGTALQAWSWVPAQGGWTQLRPSTPLALTGDWLVKPEYFSTIRTGDVDGDGRDDVIARGPFGIRTWFYNRRGTGGWERYLSEGYAAFPPRQQAAFTALTALAKAENAIPDTAASVRDVWASENVPQASDLTALLGTGSGGLGPIAGCSGARSGNPPRYQTCTPPPPFEALRSFTVLDWTAVVNEMLSEAYAASKVVGFFDQLDDMRQKLFIAEGAELPAIDLDLQGARHTPASFDTKSLFAGIFGIAASLAGPAEPELSAALWVASEVASTIPAASPTATSDPLQTTYAGLVDKFAKMVTEINKSIAVQSQLVRQDQGLLELVGELRGRGTWALDTIGMGSAANQGFATWVYQTLMPAVYDRYVITNCYISSPSYSYGSGECRGPTGLAVIGDTHNFTAIAQRHHWDPDFANWWETVPCYGEDAAFFDGCDWTLPPDDLMNRIWGAVSPECSYVPGKSATVWTFGCSAGVDVNSSIGANTWLFPSYWGSPDPGTDPAFRSSAAAVRSGRSAQVGPGAPVRLGRPRHGLRRTVRGRARLSVNTTLPRGMRLAGATVRINRLLFERRGHGELTRAHGDRASRPVVLRLRRAARGGVTATTTGRRGSVRIALRRTGRRGRARLTGRIGAAVFRAPRACHALPASVALDTAPLQLESRLVISDGRTRHHIRVERHLRCARDARGNIHRLVPVRYRSYRARPGLAVSLRGPSRVQPGTTARYVARVRNRRRGRDRLRSSLYDVTLHGRGPRKRINELRRGRTRTFTFTVRVPRSAGTARVGSTPRGRFCVGVGASAPGARTEGARVCSRVRAAAAPPPRVTG